MKTKIAKHVVAAALLVLAGSALAEEARRPVAVNTDGLPDHLRIRIEEKAKQGPDALRRYLESVRHIYDVRMDLIVKNDEPAAVAKAGEPSKVATTAAK